MLNGKPTVFTKVPLFHNCELHQDTTFEGAKFPTASNDDETDARAYNSLRLAMSKQEFTLGERVFIKLELEAERLIAKGIERWFYDIYKKIASYGFSILKPAICLLLVPLTFASIFYGLIESYANCASLPQHYICEYNSDLLIKTIKFTLLQSLPPLGFDRLSDELRNDIFTVQSPILDLILTCLVVIQKMLALVGWFLMGLGLRNLFKIK